VGTRAALHALGLVSATARTDAHRFYLANGMSAAAQHFTRAV
jgi:hypothetical protein